eukprot:TRINITY_DN92179_c0_g1_i1.p4 TRINITY_DN92179_c0_g1~~TRINITY_DN92179_c0_g1_i1.p4  ORF type:complete len:100 (-),score=14.80 TRINITY_DN92179_c0_g1_i1:426-725(-)
MATQPPVIGQGPLANHTEEPLPNCVDVYGEFNVSEIAEGAPVLATDSDNPECYANMVWAHENAKEHPELYPLGAKTLADFQTAASYAPAAPAQAYSSFP